LPLSAACLVAAIRCAALLQRQQQQQQQQFLRTNITDTFDRGRYSQCMHFEVSSFKSSL